MDPQYDSLTDEEQKTLRAEVQRAGGSRAVVAQRLGVHDQTILRLLAGERVQRLTLRIVRTQLVSPPAPQL